MLAELCPPALIYLIFSTTQIVIDTIKGFYNTAFLKIWVTFAFTILLNFLCKKGLGIVSWIIVFIPFILMTLIISILLIMFGLDPSTGRSKIYKSKGSRKKLIGGCGGTRYGCCSDNISPAKSLNDPCKSKRHPFRPGGGRRGAAAAAAAKGGAQGYIVKPIILPPNRIQGAYNSSQRGFLGPDGQPRGFESEVPRDEFNKKNLLGSGEKNSPESQNAIDREKGRRAWHDGKAWPSGTPPGEKPSDRAGDVNNRCQTFCSEECVGDCAKWECPICKPKKKKSKEPKENSDCEAFCKKGSACTEQCKSWGCSNCIPAAPADLLTKCKTPSPSCAEACEKMGDICLFNKGTPNARLNPNQECLPWGACMILNEASGRPDGKSKHGDVDGKYVISVKKDN